MSILYVRFWLVFTKMYFRIWRILPFYGEIYLVFSFIYCRLYITAPLDLMKLYLLSFTSDFLTRSYDIGGVISVMALSGLFVLMTKHGLEYPKFYEKLYALLTPAVFMAKHRAMFFQVSSIKVCLCYLNYL